MPEPIQSAARDFTHYDPSQDVCSAPVLAESAQAPVRDSSTLPAASAPAVALLVSQHPPGGAQAAPQCLPQKAALITASGALLRSAGALAVATPTLVGAIPAITAFIGSAIAVGATAAMYANCKDDAAAPSDPSRAPR